MNIGEFVVYTTHGVCRIVDIAPCSFGDPLQSYYHLIPVFAIDSCTMYVPVLSENARLIRPVMTKEKAKELLENVNNDKKVDLDAEKNRKDLYKKVLRDMSPEMMLETLKAVRERKVKLQMQNKQLSQMDVDFDRTVRRILASELSISLDVDIKEAQDILIDIIDFG